MYWLISLLISWLMVGGLLVCWLVWVACLLILLNAGNVLATASSGTSHRMRGTFLQCSQVSIQGSADELD